MSLWTRKTDTPTTTKAETTARRDSQPVGEDQFELGAEGGVAHQQIQSLGKRICQKRTAFLDLRDQMSRVVVGQRDLIDRALISLLVQGHLLIEGVPGLAKTTTVATLARATHATFQRVQFTPDLLPADLVGTQIYHPQEHRFEVQKGPVFANIVLADEINRAPAKVQSALLEAMQERQVTIGEETFPLPDPFLVIATQNPIDQEGTYPLPEAQMDRFMMKALVHPPNREEEIQILERMARTVPPEAVQPVLQPEDLRAARELIDEIYLDHRIRDFIVDLVMVTRNPAAYSAELDTLIQYGVSPRATIYLTLAAKAHAFLEGRGYVAPLDVLKNVASVLRHRIILTYEAEAEERTTDDVIEMMLELVSTP